MSEAHPVFGIERARCLALEGGDISFLEAMLSDALVYVHSTGVVNDKDSLLAYLRERVQFTKVQRANLKLFEERGTVWLTGLMRLGGRRIPGNEPFASTSFVTQIWTRDAEHCEGVRQKAASAQIEQRRDQLAFGQVARRSEDDHQAGRHHRRTRMLLGRTLDRRVAREAVAFFQMHVLTVTDHTARS